MVIVGSHPCENARSAMHECPGSMRAVVAQRPGGPEVLEVVDVPVPVAGAGEVLLQAHMASVNFADVYRRRGIQAVGFPLIPGLEAVGRVAVVGPGVTGVNVGQRVAAFARGGVSGSYAEFVVAPASTLLVVPDELTDEQAASFPIVGLTAFHALASAARLQPGESVLVTAASGGVGGVAIQVARLLGADVIIAAAGSESRARHGLELGASHALNYSDQDVASGLRDLGFSEGVGVILDGVGGRVRQECFTALGPFGRLVHFGNASAEPEQPLDETLARNRLIGSIGFSLRELRRCRPDSVRASAEKVIDWILESSLRIEVDDVIPLEEARAAHARIESRNVTGKLLIRIAEC
jgi:NADPH:quinone reductase